MIKNKKFFDLKTSEFTADICLYNSNNQIISFVKKYFYFDSSSVLIEKSSIISFKEKSFLYRSDSFLKIFEIMFFIFYVIYCIREFIILFYASQRVKLLKFIKIIN